MEPAASNILAGLSEPVTHLLGGLLLLSKTVAMVVFAMVGGEMQSRGVAYVPANPILTDLSVVFYTDADRFTPSGPVQFSLKYDEGRPAFVAMQLIPLDIIGFGDFTARHVGQNVTLQVCGQVMMSPRVVVAIRDGRLQVTGFDVVKDLTGFMENGCP